MNYLIALCDDEKAELDKTEKLLNDYEEKHPEINFTIKCFESADELLYMIKEKNYAPNLIFLDIFMPGHKGQQDSLGMEAAKELRDMGNRANLVFLTTSSEYALDAFDVDASQYLLKPVTEKRLFLALDSFMDSADAERKKYILLRIDGRLARVHVNDIVYCEAQGKKQRLYLTNSGEILLRMTMTEIYEQLSEYPEFVRIGAAFIVNLDYIDSMSAQDIFLNTGKKIYLPRGAYKILKELYFRYYCEEDF